MKHLTDTEAQAGKQVGSGADVARCAGCGADVRIDERPMVGEVVHCGHCSRALEVVEIDPPALTLLAKVEEDEEDFSD